MAAAKHWDYILSSRLYNTHSGTFTNGYLRVGRWAPKASDPDGKLLNSTMAPLLEKLFADGALHDYQIDQEDVHSTTPGTTFIAINANGAEGLDKFEAALDETEKSNPAAWVGFGTTLEEKSHTDFLARVSSSTNK